MSHKATNWLSGIPAAALTNSEFRVLFHLCDCHNPSAGCFPTQAYLIGACAISNGTLNNALNGLEAKGHIQRFQERDDRTRRQRPTRYVLGFELQAQTAPSPETGDGSGSATGKRPRLQGAGGGARRSPSPKTGGGTRGKLSPKTGAGTRGTPSPKAGAGAVSNLRGEPSPVSRGSRLQPAGEVTCKEPVINPGAPPQPSRNPFVVADAERAVARFREGRTEALSELQPWVLNHIIAADLLTSEERRLAGMG